MLRFSRLARVRRPRHGCSGRFFVDDSYCISKYERDHAARSHDGYYVYASNRNSVSLSSYIGAVRTPLFRPIRSQYSKILRSDWLLGAKNHRKSARAYGSGQAEGLFPGMQFLVCVGLRRFLSL